MTSHASIHSLLYRFAGGQSSMLGRQESVHRRASSSADENPVGTLRLARVVAVACLLGLLLHASHDQAEAAAPALSVGVPSDITALIGSQVDFSIQLTPSGSTGDIGYAPFVDVLVPMLGKDGNTKYGLQTIKCDGLQFVSASVAGMPAISPLYEPSLTAMNEMNCASMGPATHPFPPLTTPGTAGSRLVTLPLPLGPYGVGEPPISVDVSLLVSDYADHDEPLTVSVRAGYRYADSPQGTKPPTVGAWQTFDITPKVIVLSKKYLGPEKEAATGASHKPGYPLRYHIEAQVAAGKSAQDVHIVDTLPDNMIYDGLHDPGGATLPVPDQVNGPGPTPGTNAELELVYNNVTGLPATLVAELDFHVGLLDAGGAAVLPPDCAPQPSVNKLKATVEWLPLDPRDLPGPNDPPFEVELDPADVFMNKCVALQKTAKLIDDTGAPGLTPGDTIEYTLAFQVSDYRVLGDIVLEDHLADGQDLGSSTSWQLSVHDFTHPAPVALDLDYIQVTAPDPDLVCRGFYPGTTVPFEVTGGARIVIPVSDALKGKATGSATMANGLLRGDPGGKIPAEGKFVFTAIVRDEYIYTQGIGTHWVKKHDPICNAAGLHGRIYQDSEIPGVFQPTTGVADYAGSQDGATVALIANGALKKAVYARNGTVGGWDASPSSGLPVFTTGDVVTYDLSKMLPSGDAEAVSLQDWPPPPALDLNEMTAFFSGPSGPPLPTCGGGFPAIPPAGQACWYETPSSPSAVDAPLGVTLQWDKAGNSLKLGIGDTHDTDNAVHTVGLRYSLSVTDQPFVDGLHMRNLARECERNTHGIWFCQDTSAEIEIAAPYLRLRKGVVASSKDGSGSPPVYAAFDPTDTNNKFHPFTKKTGCKRFTSLTSSDLGQLPTQVTGLDAGDTVTFAVIVENIGHGPYGAFDVTVGDLLPAGFSVLGTPCVEDGAGTTMPLIGSNTNLFMSPWLKLDDPTPTQGALGAFSATSGKNIAVIYFDARLDDPNIAVGCHVNTAELKAYAARPAGTNYVTAGLTQGSPAEAQVCIAPTLYKEVYGSSEFHTSDLMTGDSKATARPLAIGEIVKFLVTVGVPEGTSPTFAVKDVLPTDLAYLPGTAVVTAVGSGVTGVNVGDQPVESGGPFGCLKGAVPPTLSFGNVKNSGFGSNNAPGVLIFELNAQVCNTPNNNQGETKENFVEAYTDGKLRSASNSAWLKVVEPTLTLTKSFATDSLPTPLTLGDAIPFRVELSNASGVTAFDVKLVDLVPSGYVTTPAPLPPTLQQVPAGCAKGVVVTGALEYVIDEMPDGCTVRFEFARTVRVLSCPSLVNVARVTWTSLPGPNGTPLVDPNTGGPTFNTTGSEIQAASGTPDGERDGSDGPGGLVDDYAAEATRTVCGQVCGSKFDDRDNDGEWDQFELAMGGWNVELQAGGGIVGTAATAGVQPNPNAPPEGSYCVTVLPGQYQVGEVMTQQQKDSGWVQTAPTAPGTWDVQVGYAETVRDIDFGNHLPVTCDTVVSGFKWSDADGDGVKDVPEPFLGGWAIQAVDQITGKIVATTLTKSDGSYSLKIKGPGAFIVQEVGKGGYVQTHPNPPRQYLVIIECDAQGNTLPVEVLLTNPDEPVSPTRLIFGNQPTGCPSGLKVLGMSNWLYVWGDDPLAGVIGGVPSAVSPNVVKGTYKAVAQGVWHTVALTAGGDLQSWGGPPSYWPGVSTNPFREIAAGSGFTVALDSQGVIHSWRAGTAMSQPLPGCQSGNTYCTSGSLDKFITVSAGYDNVMAVDVDGDVHTWAADNSFGQSPGTPDSLEPTHYVLAGDYRTVAAGGDYNLAIDTAGTIHGWGWNLYGAIPGSENSTACPSVYSGVYCTAVAATGEFRSLAIGSGHTVALDSNGAIYGWGSATLSAIPGGKVGTPFGSGYLAVAASGSPATVALRSNRTLQTWGTFQGNSPPVTPPGGIYFAIAGGGVDAGHLAALRCPVFHRPGGIVGQIFLPSTSQGGSVGGVPPTSTWTPTSTPSVTVTATPSKTPTRTPDGATQTPTPSATQPTHTATATSTRTSTVTPSPAPTVNITGEIATSRGCSTGGNVVRFSPGETVPIMVRVDGVAQATVRVMYQWPAGGQERQIDGGPINGGTTYTVNPALVLAADVPLGGRRLSFQLLEDGSYREIAECAFDVEGGGPSPTPQAQCMPLSSLPGLVAWWPLDSVVGEMVPDLVANPTLNHGLLYGLPGTLGAGKVDKALFFDGQNTHIRVPDHASLNVQPREDFSIDTWIKLPEGAFTSGVKSLLNKQASSGGAGYQLYLFNGQLGLQIADDTGYTNFGSGVPVPNDDSWHLIAVSIDRDASDGVRFYLDGQPVGPSLDPRVRSGGLSNSTELYIGRASFQDAADFNGWLDEVEFFKRAITSAEVSALYAADSHGKCEPTPGPTVPPLDDRLLDWRSGH